ncbi:hypothetical protein [Pseudomonas akapageensis]|uniref:hypothetical protein n=1 Tax=Pseudomonas akapageensis TaxID=2609961 RepID=UPI001407A561|nr:hypothetical protein [Pseudomonas akapageensis]
MARRIAYTGPPVMTMAQVAFQCRIEPEDMQPELVEQIIIPGVTAFCEAKTGAAIRQASYVEDWPEHYLTGHALDIGQATEVSSLAVVQPDGSLLDQTGPFDLRQGSRESFLHFGAGRPAGVLRIRYQAGVDLAAYPSVLSWLLMSAATAYQQRETLVVGQMLTELPSSFLDHLLADITVPPRF